jgi:hypothetical protein
MSNEITIAQKNRAICEFTGWEFKEVNSDWYHAFFDGKLQWADDKEGLEEIMTKGFRYHEDWNKLMPVVEKIEKIENSRFGFTIDPLGVEITDYKDKPSGGPIISVSAYLDNGDTKISMIYDAIYQFIQWHNKQQSNEQPTTGNN